MLLYRACWVGSAPVAVTARSSDGPSTVCYISFLIKHFTRWRKENTPVPLGLFYYWLVFIGIEARIVNRSDEKHLEVFEMWCYKRVLKVSMIEILERLNKILEIINSINKRKLDYFGEAPNRDYNKILCKEKMRANASKSKTNFMVKELERLVWYGYKHAF